MLAALAALAVIAAAPPATHQDDSDCIPAALPKEDGTGARPAQSSDERQRVPATQSIDGTVSTPVGVADDDAARIPNAPKEAGKSVGNSDLFVAATIAPQFRVLRRDIAIPLPGVPSGRYNILNRLFVDVRATPDIAPRLRFLVSARLNSIEPLEGDYADNNVRLDLREAFLTWSPNGGPIIELGRINARSGVAAAFNPTDFFRGRTVVDIVSVDPSVLRLNRLGVAMGRVTATSGAAALSLTLVPKLADREPVLQGRRSFANLRLGRTNPANAAELHGSVDLANGTSLQISALLREGRSPSFGANAVRGIGDDATVFVEAALIRSADVISESVHEGIQSGELSAFAGDLIPLGARRYRPSFAVGITYTLGKVTLTAEYDHDEAGLDRRQWRDLVSRVRAAPSAPLARGTFWYARSLVQQQQQLVSRGQAFARIGWDDAFGRKNLAISALALVPTTDRSILAQGGIDYKPSDAWSLGGIVQVGAGSRASLFGGSPQAAGVRAYATRYF